MERAAALQFLATSHVRAVPHCRVYSVHNSCFNMTFRCAKEFLPSGGDLNRRLRCAQKSQLKNARFSLLLFARSVCRLRAPNIQQIFLVQQKTSAHFCLFRFLRFWSRISRLRAGTSFLSLGLEFCIDGTHKRFGNAVFPP